MVYLDITKFDYVASFVWFSPQGFRFSRPPIVAARCRICIFVIVLFVFLCEIAFENCMETRYKSM